MATPQGATTSNSFRVSNGELFIGEMEKLFPNVRVESCQDEVGDSALRPGETRVSLYADDGYWPIESECLTERHDVPIDFFRFVSVYVAENELAMLHSVSMQGPSDVRFQSVSIARGGKIRDIDLSSVEAFHRAIHLTGGK